MVVCVNSGTEVTKKDEFVCTGCCRMSRLSNLSLTSSWLVIVGAWALMMDACLLLDKGSLSVIMRSLMPLESPESVPTMSVLMANPTPPSRLSSDLRLIQKNANQYQLLLYLLPLQGESHSGQLSLFCTCHQELFYAVVSLSDPALSISMRSRRQLSKVSRLSFFFVFDRNGGSR